METQALIYPSVMCNASIGSNITRFLPAVWTAILLSSGSNVLAAPPQVYNKTITVSWTVIPNGRADDGSVLTTPGKQGGTIYISSKGRIFFRSMRQAGRYATSRDVAPQDANNSLHFEGSKLVGALRVQSGANQMVISFDSGFQNCTVSILYGREGGRAYRWEALNGKMYTQQGPFVVSERSCSVREGNPFTE